MNLYCKVLNSRSSWSLFHPPRVLNLPRTDSVYDRSWFSNTNPVVDPAPISGKKIKATSSSSLNFKSDLYVFSLLSY